MFIIVKELVSSNAFSSPIPKHAIKVLLEIIGVEIDDPDRPFYISIKNCAVHLKKKKTDFLLGMTTFQFEK